MIFNTGWGNWELMKDCSAENFKLKLIFLVTKFYIGTHLRYAQVLRPKMRLYIKNLPGKSRLTNLVVTGSDNENVDCHKTFFLRH